jgi:hypothetical protein
VVYWVIALQNPKMAQNATKKLLGDQPFGFHALLPNTVALTVFDSDSCPRIKK